MLEKVFWFSKCACGPHYNEHLASIHIWHFGIVVHRFGIRFLLEPVLIRKNGNAVEVIAGRGRVKAALEANKRLTAEGKQPIRVPAILKRGPDADMFGVLISENECRRDDGPLVKADKAQRLINMGKSTEEVAVAFGVTRQAVEGWLTLHDVAPPVRQAVEAGELSASAAAQLSNLGRDEQAKALEGMRAEGGKVTVTRAKKAAKEGDVSKPPKMRTRKAIEDILYHTKCKLHSTDGCLPVNFRREYEEGFCAGLRWVLGIENQTDAGGAGPNESLF